MCNKLKMREEITQNVFFKIYHKQDFFDERSALKIEGGYFTSYK